MMTRLALIATLALPALAFANPSSDKLSDADVRIIAHVHAVNQAEIDMGKLAKTNGSPGVNKYGDILVRDHTSADKDITALAKKHGLIEIPADTALALADRTDQKTNIDTMTHLKTLKGASFDRYFLVAMMNGHTKEIAKVETAMKTASDPALVTMLGGIKPVMQKHLDDATRLQKMTAPKS